MHLSCLQRDEIEDDAYNSCDVLIINWHGMEFNRTSSLLKKRYGIEVKDHPKPLNVEWDSLPTLGELVTEQVPGRTSEAQITGFMNNIGLGAQFAAVGARVLELARQKNLGRELPVEWFLQDIHP